jgi:hypothetical protein
MIWTNLVSMMVVSYTILPGWTTSMICRTASEKLSAPCSSCQRSIVLGILRTFIVAFLTAASRWMEDWRRQLWRNAANEGLRPAPFLRHQVVAATRALRPIKVKTVTIRADETDQLRHVGIVV